MIDPAQAMNEIEQILSWAIDPSLFELSRMMIRASEIDDTVISAFFRTLSSHRISFLPVHFVPATMHLQIPPRLLITWHTPCIGIVVPVGGEANAIDADH